MAKRKLHCPDATANQYELMCPFICSSSETILDWQKATLIDFAGLTAKTQLNVVFLIDPGWRNIICMIITIIQKLFKKKKGGDFNF